MTVVNPVNNKLGKEKDYVIDYISYCFDCCGCGSLAD